MNIFRRGSLLVMCALALANLYAAPDPFLVEALKPLAAQGKLLWSSEATVTDAAKASGLLEQGKSHLKITGPITTAQVTEISGTLLKSENKNQLVKLDFSGTSGLAELERNAFRNRPNLGSILLPEGLTFIERDAFLDASCLIELSLPETLATVNGNSFNRTALPMVALPPKTEWNGFRFVSSALSCVIIFKEGRGSVKLSGFAPDAKAKGTRLVFALPSTLTEISAVDSDTGNFVTELYCYAAKPPAYKGSPGMVFPNAKTFYVPANSVNAYKSAWQALTRAEFRALPPEKPNLAAWLVPVDTAEAYKAAGGK